MEKLAIEKFYAKRIYSKRQNNESSSLFALDLCYASKRVDQNYRALSPFYYS